MKIKSISTKQSETADFTPSAAQCMISNN